MARKHGESRASETQQQLREEQTSYSRLPKRAKTKTGLECYESHVASRPYRDCTRMRHTALVRTGMQSVYNTPLRS